MSAEPSALPPKKSKKKLILVLVATVVLLAGGGAGAWFYISAKNAAALAATEDGEGPQPAEAVSKHGKDKEKKPVFTTLETFTVNLNDPSGARLAQIGIAFEVEDVNVDTLIKDHLPAVRNDILLLLSSKKIDELLNVEGKQALARKIRVVTAKAIGVEVEDDEVGDQVPEEKTDNHAEKPSPDGKKSPAKKSAKKKAPANPIKEVLFSTFLVQ
jgi:flagellar protein FliL